MAKNRFDDLTPEQLDELCERIAVGESILSIVERPGINETGLPRNRSTIQKLRNRHEYINERLIAAEKLSVNAIMDEIMGLIEEEPDALMDDCVNKDYKDGRITVSLFNAKIHNRNRRIDFLKERLRLLNPDRFVPVNKNVNTNIDVTSEAAGKTMEELEAEIEKAYKDKIAEKRKNLKIVKKG